MGDQYNTVTDTVQIDQQFVFRFVRISTGDVDEVSIKDAESRTEAYQQAREVLLEKHKRSIRTFEKDWRLDHTERHISFSNAPWTTREELIEDLKNIEGVQTALYLPPEETEYNPPTIYVRTAPFTETEHIVLSIKEYFDGLRVEEGDQDLFVIVNPSYYVGRD